MQSYEASYAGVGLSVPTPEFWARIDFMLSFCDVRDVQAPARWPGKNRTDLAWENPPTYPRPRIGQLFWPCGASRWAIGHFLASGSQVKQIKTQVVDGSSYIGKDLILRCDGSDASNATTNSITAKMYLLPPRPLGGFNTPLDQTDAEKDSYLLTLVDIRYFWQWVPVDVDGGTEDTPQTWLDLYGLLATALGVTLTAGSIDSKYGVVEPDSSIFANKENTALILDAALANTGRVLAANYDGTFTIQKVIDARTAVKTTRDTWKDERQSGGPVLTLDSATPDFWRKAVLPSTVVVTFPQWLDGVGYYKPSPQYRGWILDGYNGIYTSTVDMTALTDYSQYIGTSLTWKKTFHDTAKAIYPDATAVTDEDDPNNKTDLDDLAKQLAKDYADALIARLDESYPGMVPWTPDGLNDVLFVHQLEDSWTRVQGRPWNTGVEEMQHGFGPLPNSESSTVKLIRTVAGVVGDGPDGVSALLDSPTGVYGYYSYVQEWSKITGSAPPDDTAQEVIYVPYYEEAVWGSLPDVLLNPGEAYPGLYAGVSATITIDLNDGPDPEDPSNPQPKTLPVYWFTLKPITGSCVDDSPEWSGMGV